MSSSELSVDEASELCHQILDEIESAVIGRRSFFENVLMGILARRHVLLEDVPGTGKTLTARMFASALGLEFSRVQFTPDLLPTDVLGTSIFNEQNQEFEFQPGPIFGNIVLGDEINRAPPKTQAAMLEAMEEQQVSIEGETRSLPDPFFVIATQNPVEQEGTFPLPEAQVDRFLVKDTIGYPDQEGEEEILHRRAGRLEGSPSVDRVIESAEELRRLQKVPEGIHVNDDLVTYISSITRASRDDERVQVGVSPRGTQRLFEAARARAVIEGREYVNPDDVKRIAHPVLDHRLVMTAEAKVNDIPESDVIDNVLEEVPVPTTELPQ